MNKLTKTGYLLFLPAMLCFLIFYYWPLIVNIGMSFFSWNMVSSKIKFVGLDNYIDVLQNGEFYSIIINTILFVVFLLIFNFILPYIYSYTLAYILKYGKNLYKIFFFIPSLFSLSVASILFLWIYNPLAGPIFTILQTFGLESPRWLKEPILVIFSISLIIAWKVFGYNFILMLAAMMSVSKEMIEAARLEGASDWMILRNIIIPQTSSSAIYVFVITVVFGLQYVMIPVNILTQGGPNQGSANLVYVIYQYAFVFYQVGKSAAYAVVTMILFVLFAWWRNKVLDKKVYYEN
ncbi:carbohydrate ABC transporter permease [Veillonella criceti]|uniref:sn-glycerol-3-phosphate transport system permease protein ugpA n=1 Tax=Veillonella criceti TaxID=103891 RepID=A0A380NN50_9FIRM|nr:sugar ABC transporter permease [Veillonella criceti]SUP43888.1 sn-glycerol-3-phosphate transport system permease protein ugpA [Veillonella criceti]